MTAIAFRLATLGGLLGLAVAAGDDHDGHDHDGHDHEAHGESEMGFEWAGIFATPESHYMWTAQKVNGAYADPAMKLVALPATDITEAGLHALEEEGKHSMEKNCTEVEAGETIVPAEDTCYHLHFQADAWQSLFNVDASGVSGIAFFAEHVPTEFEATAHYLKDGIGEDIEPVAQLPAGNTEATATTGLEDRPHCGRDPGKHHHLHRSGLALPASAEGSGEACVQRYALRLCCGRLAGLRLLLVAL